MSYAVVVVSHAEQDGMYANFAGRDASRGMAKQSFDEGAYTELHSTHTSRGY